MGALLAPHAQAHAATARALSDEDFAAIQAGAWRPLPGCPGRAELRVVRVRYLTFDGAPADGELVVAEAVAAPTCELFERLWRLGFPIRRMCRMEAYGGCDDAAMADDNTSALNVRTVAGSARLSMHAYGVAIDINPVENPWVRGAVIAPAAGAGYVDRTSVRPGMIVRPGPVVRAFDELGWEWGGDWVHARDYHHIVWRGRV